MENLEKQISDLEKESASMHSIIVAENHIPTKTRLIANHARVLRQISILTEKKNQIEQVEYAKKLEALITENGQAIFFAVNDVRHSIGKNNEVEITFPCGHKLKLQLKELLRKGLFGTLTNKSLYEKWQNMMRTNVTYSSTMYCQQCQEDAQKLGRKDAHISSVSWTLRRLS